MQALDGATVAITQGSFGTAMVGLCFDFEGSCHVAGHR